MFKNITGTQIVALLISFLLGCALNEVISQQSRAVVIVNVKCDKGGHPSIEKKVIKPKSTFSLPEWT